MTDGDVGPIPIDGQPLLLAGVKASIAPDRLPELLARAQRLFSDRIDRYRRQYERIHVGDDREVFLVPADHWQSVCAELAIDRRSCDGIRRAHVEQFKRLGSQTDRRKEFDTALEIRSAVVIGTGDRFATE
ncbi:MAG: hypothetical protein ACQETB_01655 [Halobacteriota archaeon]